MKNELCALRVVACVFLTVASSCASVRPGAGDGGDSFAFALMGDMPYAQEDEARFEQMMQEINEDDGLEWVLHVGDIKTGVTPCSDDYLMNRRSLFERFEVPFVLIPGDNEWTDCHRPAAGGYRPLERLQKLRDLFYAEPGRSLGKPALQMDTQASDPRFEEFPEHVRWVRNGVVFAGMHVVGSQNGTASFEGRTAADDLEAERRMAAAIQWMKDAFELAHRLNSPGLFLMIHANPGFIPSGGQQVFEPFLRTLEIETIRFGKPVLFAHGDSHYFRIDKPLISSDSGRRIENFTRVETFGAGDVHWLRVAVDPGDENVFIIKQEIVRNNATGHTPPR